jgi:hypothetical protein
MITQWPREESNFLIFTYLIDLQKSVVFKTYESEKSLNHTSIWVS